MLHPRRRAFGLLHLLVILALLFLFLGLAVPGVLQLQEKARTSHAANGLKQIGIAIHSYHDVTGKFPASIDAKGFSALAHALPYVEQDVLFKNIDFTQDASAKANDGPRGTTVKIYLDPTDEADRPLATAPTNFLLVAGTKAALDKNDGAFPGGEGIKITRIKDGTSNTLMAVCTLRGDGAEKATDVRRQHVALKKADLAGLKDTAGVKEWAAGKPVAGTRGASWLDGRHLMGSIVIGRATNDDKPDVDCEGLGGFAGVRTLPGRPAVVGLCDGSAKSLNPKTTLETLKIAAGRADNLPMPADW